MKFFSLVLLSLIAVSFADPSFGTEEAGLTKADLKTDALTEVCQNTNQEKDSEYENSDSMLYYAKKFQEFSAMLTYSYLNENINLGYFHSTMTLILELAEKYKVSNLSKEDKEAMEIWIKEFMTCKVRNLHKIAEKKCKEKIYHFTPDCIYFNFESYAAAVEAFQGATEENSETVSNYDALDQASKEKLLDTFRSLNHEFQRLSVVLAEEWVFKDDIKRVMQMFSDASKIHNETIAILKSKGVDI